MIYVVNFPLVPPPHTPHTIHTFRSSHHHHQCQCQCQCSAAFHILSLVSLHISIPYNLPRRRIPASLTLSPITRRDFCPRSVANMDPTAASFAAHQNSRNPNIVPRYPQHPLSQHGHHLHQHLQQGPPPSASGSLFPSIDVDALAAGVQRFLPGRPSAGYPHNNSYITLPPGVDPATVDFRTFYPYNPSEVKHRKRTTRPQLKVLEETFKRETKPNAALRKQLAAQLEMTPRGVQVSLVFLFLFSVVFFSFSPSLDTRASNWFCSASSPRPFRFSLAYHDRRLSPPLYSRVLCFQSSLFPSIFSYLSSMTRVVPTCAPASFLSLPLFLLLAPANVLTNPCLFHF